MKKKDKLDDLLNSSVIIEQYEKAGYLIDRSKFNPDDPEIMVVGVGKIKLKQLKKQIIENLKKAVDLAESDEFDAVNSIISPKNILSHYVSAILDINSEMKKPSIKNKIKLMREAKLAKAQENEKEDPPEGSEPMIESAPPSKKIESWILKMKPIFKKEYGEKWKEVLYRTAWAMYNAKKK